jgi:hypothetical protein
MWMVQLWSGCNKCVGVRRGYQVFMERTGQGHTCKCACGYVSMVKKDAGPVAVQIRFRSPSYMILGRRDLED